MGPFAAGQVVLLPFPFSDLSQSKLRPALLLANADREDWIACQITSNAYADARAIALADDAFAEGGLHRISYVRPGNFSPPAKPSSWAAPARSDRVFSSRCAMPWRY
jgi:mRNA interferase MazF